MGVGVDSWGHGEKKYPVLEKLPTEEMELSTAEGAVLGGSRSRRLKKRGWA